MDHLHRTLALQSLAIGLLMLGFAHQAAAQEPALQEADPVPETAPQEAAPQEPPAEQSAETSEPGEKPKRLPWLGGSFETNLRLEMSDRDSNVLLDQFLRLNVDPPQKQRFRLRAGVWAIEDLDHHEDPTSTLSTIHNTYEASVQVRLLHLYAEWDEVWGNSTLRIGRQRILENPAYPRIDGVYFTRRRPRWDWYAFGGARASLYESSYEDGTAGGGIAWNISTRTRLMFDGFYGEEDRSESDEVRPGPLVNFLRLPFPRRVDREIDSKVYSASIQHQLRPSHYLFGRYTAYEGESDELLLTASGVFVESDIAYDLSYRRRQNTLGDRTNEVTGFYRVLGEQNEFDEISANVNLPLSLKWAVNLETQLRQTESDDPDTANRDFRRFVAGLEGVEVWKGVSTRLNAEYWDVADGESSFAVTGEASRKWGAWEGTLGVDFARWEDRIVEYRPFVYGGTRVVGTQIPFVRRFASIIAGLFDTEVVETHENIYSVYGQADYTINENQSAGARVSWEEDDGPDSPYWYARLTYRIRF